MCVCVCNSIMTAIRLHWLSLEGKIKKLYFLMTRGEGVCDTAHTRVACECTCQERLHTVPSTRQQSQRCTYNCSQGGSLSAALPRHRAGHEAIRTIIGGAQLVCPPSSPFSLHLHKQNARYALILGSCCGNKAVAGL